MKKSVKAALLSGLVFPGLGQIYLKRRRRGVVIMLVVLALLGFLIWMTVTAVLQSLEKLQGQGLIDASDTSALAASISVSHSPYYNAVLIAVVCCWLYAVIDAYRAGKE